MGRRVECLNLKFFTLYNWLLCADAASFPNSQIGKLGAVFFIPLVLKNVCSSNIFIFGIGGVALFV